MQQWAWRLGMLVLAGVPAIVGGGVFWTLFGKWTGVIVWEVVLLFLISLIISKGDQRAKLEGPH
ncbi:MAG: hypothetical protein COT06_05410 [Syntrophobacteraceae bacterium CG07_land_8_20_14_0_80_61_8]|nr:MAG: hypothetical protein COT06_05410 [Syntrophobacteraceae bacterium CG07_land_8_20_14_0_80_61_8]